MTSRVRWRWLAVVVAAGLVLAGCGGGSNQNVGDASGGATASSAQISAADPNTLRDGGDFVWPEDSLPPNYNYNQIDGTYVPNDEILRAMMPYIWRIDAQGNVAPNPDYLTSADLTGTNPQVVTLNLNPRAVWQNGRPIDWTDFQAQWQAMNGKNPAFQVSSSTGYQDIANVAAGTNPQQVVITFAKNFGDWRSLFDPLFPRETNADPNVFNSGWVNQPLPYAAGPFRFDSIDPVAKRLTLVRNERWWGQRARLDRIIFLGLDTDAQPEAYANGTTTFYDISSSVPKFQRAQQIPNTEVRISNGPNYNHLTFNGAPGAILSDVNLRLALQRGIDRSVLTKALIGPIIPNATPLGNHVFMAGLTGYQDNSGIVAYDPNAANAQLDQLGWVRQGNLRVKNGQPLRVRMVIPSGNQTSDQTARIVQQQWSALGVQLDIQAVPTANFFKQYVNVGNFDVAPFSWYGTPFPVSSVGSILGLYPDVQQNFGRIGTEQLNQTIAAAAMELDPTKARQLANDMDKQVWADGHSLLLFQRPNAIATHPNVANFGAKGFSELNYAAIGFRN